MPIGIEWARASQFNWTFCNMGGTPLQEMVSGLWSGVTFVVTDGAIVIPEESGGGKVYYMRGVWDKDALFAWGGFWVNPEGGETDYYAGGSFVNSGNETVVTLGTSLPNGTEVQAYYIYNTGEKTAKYEAINSTPCMRLAWRSASDYTYDFAVDRIFDAMAAVYFAYKEQGLDPSDILEFFWNTYIENAASNGNPLIFDNFNRAFYDRGNYLMYVDSSQGQLGFDQFGPELPPDDVTGGRALRFKPAYYGGSAFSAWFGYGFNWDLTKEYFDTIGQIRFKLRGSGQVTRVQKFIKTAGNGTANMILIDEFDTASVKYYYLVVTTGGAPGVAQASLSVYKANLELESTSTITCPSSTGYVNLGHGLKAYWEDGVLAAGDTYYITAGNEEIKPQKLLVTLNNSIITDLDPWGEEHSFIHALGDYYPELTDVEIDFSQFWRLGNIIDCRDRRAGRWGNWSTHHLAVGAPYEMLFYDVAETMEVDGETFYTKQRFTWNLDPDTALALGYYVGIPAAVDSTAATDINYLIKHYHSSDLTFTTKVRDANGTYLTHDDSVPPNVWTRVTIPLASFGAVVHPLDFVEIGIASGPPAQGSFEVMDLKFDDHLTFTSADNLRIVEFKHQESSLRLGSGPDWYLDDFGFDLSVEDPYPYVPRLAISLNSYGRNPWRGPTIIHYSHPLAPFLMNRFDIKNTKLRLHTDAQDEFYSRYGGLKGPIMPVHTRNDIENIALCGEESFNSFTWWPLYRNLGKDMGCWRFNENLGDESGDHILSWLGGGSPSYTDGMCQPGNTAVAFDGAHGAQLSSSDEMDIGTEDFTIEVIFKRSAISLAQIVRLISKRTAAPNKGYELIIHTADYLGILVADGSGFTIVYPQPYLYVADTTDWHYVAVSVDRDGLVTMCLDGAISTADAARPDSCSNTAKFTVGRYASSASYFFQGDIDFVRVYKDFLMDSDEMIGRWQVVGGELNGSDYPEVGHGLGQYWSFYRIAEHFFVSNDAGAWDILDNWLTWFDTYLAVDGPSYKFPVWFSEYGYAYGDYDPGAAASIVVGCLYVYMRNGDSRALALSQNILSDLRQYRASGDYGGYLYKSDYHYAWMNALVAHAVGMAVVGRAGAAYRYPFTAADEAHFQNIIANFWAMSGDSKPNLLNADLIPFHDCEPHDIWDYAPDYLFMKEMGSMEGVVLMMHAALDWALYSGSYSWFNRLLEFMIRLGQAKLSEKQIYSINSNFMTSNVATKVNLSYGDYRRDNTLFQEASNQSMIDLLGEIRRSLSMHYGSPVITENANTAAKIAQRALEYFSIPKEQVQVVADLAAARFDLNDVVKVESKFHGFASDDFYLTRRLYDKKKLRVTLDLMRNVNYSPSWAVDADGTEYDSYAIDTNSNQDSNWTYKSYAN